MTIDELAGIVVKGFKDIEERFEARFQDVFATIDDLAIAVAKGFQEVDHRFNAIDVRLDRVEGRLDSVEGRLEGVENRLVGVEHKVDALRSDMSSVIFDAKKTQERVENLEIRTFGSIQAA